MAIASQVAVRPPPSEPYGYPSGCCGTTTHAAPAYRSRSSVTGTKLRARALRGNAIPSRLRGCATISTRTSRPSTASAKVRKSRARSFPTVRTYGSPLCAPAGEPRVVVTRARRVVDPRVDAEIHEMVEADERGVRLTPGPNVLEKRSPRVLEDERRADHRAYDSRLSVRPCTVTHSRLTALG